MKKHVKNYFDKLIVFLLCLALLAGHIPYAFAEGEGPEGEITEAGAPEADPADPASSPECLPVDSGTCGNELTWELYGDGELIISGTGDMDNYSMSALAPWAASEVSITMVTIEPGVTSIGDYAFYNSTNITNTPSNCNLTNIVIPEGVTSIGKGAFYGCYTLTGAALPGSVESIGERAFCACGAFTGIEIPCGVTSLEEAVFEGCENLTQVVIPDSVIECGAYVFSGCYKLKEIVLPQGLNRIGSSMFSGCKRLTDITIPESVKSIEYGAFAGCSSLESIVIPDSVARTEESAFSSCSSLKEITLPQGLESISASLFFGCISLTDITIPASVRSICAGAFQECGKLTELTIPEGVESIESGAFAGCADLYKVIILNDNISIDDIAFGNFLPADPVICARKGSAAEAYAVENGFDFLEYTDGVGTDPAEEPSGESGEALIDISAAKVYGLSEVQYRGDGFQHRISNYSVFYNGDSLREGKDFSVFFQDNTGLGTAKMVVTGQGRFTGTKIFTFQINYIYYLYYDANGGEGEYHCTLRGGITTILNPPDISREGYMIVSWNTKPDGTGTDYPHGAEACDLTGPNVDGTIPSIVLYAQWEELPTFNGTVHFDANGGTGTMEDQEIFFDGTEASTGFYPQLNVNAFERTYYHFWGWNTEPDNSGTSFNDEQPVYISDFTAAGGNELTLYAQWEQSYYIIRFDANGGEGWMGVMSMQGGESKALYQNAFTRSGYSFAGWNTKADGSGTAYRNEETVKDLSLVFAAEVMLYAQWEDEPQTDISDAEVLGLGKMYYNGSPLYQTQHIYVDGVLLEEGLDYTVVFENNIQPGEARVVYTGIGRYTGVKVATFEIGWFYYIVYYGNGGEGETHTEHVPSGNLFGLGGKDLFKKDGYHIVSWNTEPDGSGTDYLPDQKVCDIAGVEEMVRVYAQWDRNVYTVRFNANGGTGTMEDQQMAGGVEEALRANAFTRSGYRFTGWNPDEYAEGPVYEDRAAVKNLGRSHGAIVILYAQWEEIQEPEEPTTQEPEEPTTQESEEPTTQESTPQMVQAAVKTYTVKFAANGGTGTMSSKKMTYGKSVVLTANAFKRKGYTFAGWNTKADGSGKTYANKATVKNLTSKDGGIVTLYAQWKANTYTIKFNANGGTGTMSSKKMTYGKSAVLTANAFKRKGYAFTGWNTKADGSGKTYTNKATVKNLTSKDGGTVTLYAQWKANTYTIKFNANGGTGTMSTKKMTYGKSWVLTANAFKRTGYAFTGWNTKADGSGKDYTNKATVKNLTSKKDGSVTLYAQWKANTYTIKFNANGGMGTMSSKKMTYGKPWVLTANAFKRTGYTFTGWNTKADGSGKAYANKATVKNLSSKKDGSVTLYAQWKKAEPVLTKLTLSGSSTVVKGFSIQLTCKTTPSGYKGKLTYSSSDTSVATVSSSGVVKGVGTGTATITVKATNGVKAAKKITVKSNSYSFGSAGSVSSYASGVTVTPKKLSYSGGTLVLTVYIVNNSSYTIDTYNNMTIAVYTDSGRKIASKNFGSVDLGIGPMSIKTMTFRFPDAEMVDLTDGGYLKTGGTFWFH